MYSVSTIGTALVVTPLYVLPAWWLAANGIGYDDVRARVVDGRRWSASPPRC